VELDSVLMPVNLNGEEKQERMTLKVFVPIAQNHS